MKEFMEVIAFILVLIWGVVIGSGTATEMHKKRIHTEKQGCEYVEKAECKQVWIKVIG